MSKLTRRRVSQIRNSTAAQEEETIVQTLRKSLKSFDVYAKPEPECQVRTTGGATLTLVVGFFIFLLFLHETIQYMSTQRVDKVAVDTSLDERLQIKLNITFFALTCSQVNLVAMDVAGEHQLQVDHEMHKTRIGPTGEVIGEKVAAEIGKTANGSPSNALPKDYCGSCYGAKGEGECCNTCESLKVAYAKKGWDTSAVLTTEQCKREHVEGSEPGEGCNLEGRLTVNKVAGNFHIALGTTKSVNGHLIHAFERSHLLTFNASHEIHELQFGKKFDGQLNPLTGTRRVYDPKVSNSGVTQYFIKLIPFAQIQNGVEVRRSNQYSFTENFIPISADRQFRALPGVFFIYDYSPFVVQRTTTGKSFWRYVVNLFAIVGGMFTLSGILDAALYRWGKKLGFSLATAK